MRGHAPGAVRPGPSPDGWIAAGAVGVLGCGTVLAGAGWATGSLEFGVLGGLLLALALIVLLTTGWVESLLLLALCLPLPALYATEALRISPAAVATALVVLAWILGRGVDGRRFALDALPHRAVLALFGSVALAAAFAQSPLPALRELVNFALILGLLVVATDLLASVPGRIRPLVLVLAGVAGSTGFLAVLEAVGMWPGRFPLPGTGFHRATLGFGWPNELAMYLAIALPLAVYACETTRAARRQVPHVLAWLALAGTILGLGATFSRGSWIAVLASTVVLLALRRRGWVVRLWVAALLSIMVLNLLFGGALQDRIAGTVEDPFIAQRVGLTLAGVLMFLAHPIVGVGPGGFAESLDRFGPEVGWLWDYVGTAHNAYVDVAAEMGLIGLTAFVAFLTTVFVILLRGARRAEDIVGQAAEDGTGEAPAAIVDEAMIDEASLRRALLWSYATVCVVGFTAWPFAHGIAQLIMLVAAAGLALEHAAPEGAPEGVPEGVPRDPTAGEPMAKWGGRS